MDLDGDGLITFYDLNDTVNQGVGKITDINGNGRIDGGDILAPMHEMPANRPGWGAGPTASPPDDPTYVDDLVGWNFVNNTNDPFDEHGHGTNTGRYDRCGRRQWPRCGRRELDGAGDGAEVPRRQRQRERPAPPAEAIRYAADHGRAGHEQQLWRRPRRHHHVQRDRLRSDDGEHLRRRRGQRRRRRHRRQQRRRSDLSVGLPPGQHHLRRRHRPERPTSSPRSPTTG